MKKKLPFKLFDIVVILLALGLTGFSAYSIYFQSRGGAAQVVIEGQGGRQRWIFPLSAEETVSVPGPLGNTIVKISEGQTWVDSSPCDNQVCVATGKLPGPISFMQFAACLPNNVMLIVEGHDDNTDTDSASW